MHAYGHNTADSWLLKDDTEAKQVMESGNEFHSVIVLAAKDFWSWNSIEQYINDESVQGNKKSFSFCGVIRPTEY